MRAYYNEIDPFKAEVLREAIKAGAIAPGDVDERSIADVQPVELMGYTQCHFFAGGGFWSLALRNAGWADDRPVWTGSCPCPSFSAAGKGTGFADPRHLWPEWFRLIRECRPGTVFGEQVAAAIGHGWLDLVSTDMETEGYAIAAAVLGAHSVGAPHIRQRLYFVAESEHTQRWPEREEYGDTYGRHGFRWSGNAGLLVEPIGAGLEGHAGHGRDGHEPGRDGAQQVGPVAAAGEPCGLADADGRNPGAERLQRGGEHRQQPEDGGTGELGDAAQRGLGIDGSASGSGGHAAQSDGALRPSPLNGFWRDADWIGCRDGKWRPVESGTFPLVAGSTARVGRLRMYGDAICVPAAQAFIEAAMEAIA